MDDFGIFEVLPKLTNEIKGKVLERLRELGVEDSDDLAAVEEDDLTENGLLSEIQARKLVKKWKESKNLKFYDNLIL